MAPASSFFKLLGEDLVSASGRQVRAVDHVAGRTAVAIYFGADGCPFTKVLAMAYASLRSRGLEVVFVSADEDEVQFQRGLRQMPWPALPFGARQDLKESLREQFGVQRIPVLVVVDTAGIVITRAGVESVCADPTCELLMFQDPDEGVKSDSAALPTGAADNTGKVVVMMRATTDELLEREAGKVPFVAILPGVCCFWIPLLFFMGAANTSTTCESRSFGTWMKAYSLLPMVSFAVLHLLAAFLVRRGNVAVAKSCFGFQGVTAMLMSAMDLVGWVEYAKTSDEKCVGDGDINPRTLTLAFLIVDCCLFATLAWCYYALARATRLSAPTMETE